MTAKLTSYRGRTALVTGASSGMGKLLAERFAREGAHVALVARRAAELESVAAEIAAAGGSALVLPCDVADREQVFAAAERAQRELGEIDILVNNAGYGGHHLFLEWDIGDMERMMQVNYFGAVYWTKALLPGMVRRREGWVVFMASVAGKLGVPDESAYAATKFAMVGMAEALSMEVEDSGVHVLTVCPGAIHTDFFDPQALARMPPVARRSMIEPKPVIEGVMRALATGKREITVPRPIATAYVIRALAPGFMRRNTKRTTIDAMGKTGAKVAPP